MGHMILSLFAFLIGLNIICFHVSSYCFNFGLVKILVVSVNLCFLILVTMKYFFYFVSINLYFFNFSLTQTYKNYK